MPKKAASNSFTLATVVVTRVADLRSTHHRGYQIGLSGRPPYNYGVTVVAYQGDRRKRGVDIVSDSHHSKLALAAEKAAEARWGSMEQRKDNGARMVPSRLKSTPANPDSAAVDRAERRDAAALGRAAAKVTRIAKKSPVVYRVRVLVKVPKAYPSEYGVRAFVLNVDLAGRMYDPSVIAGLSFAQRDAVAAAVKRAVRPASRKR